MANVPENLADIVAIAMRRHQVEGGRALSRKAQDLKVPISYTVLNQLADGTYRRKVGPDIRRNLAALSGVAQRTVDRLAGAPMSAPFNIPEDQAATLTGDQREAVLQVVRAFAKANRTGAEEPSGYVRDLHAARTRKVSDE